MLSEIIKLVATENLEFQDLDEVILSALSSNIRAVKTSTHGAEVLVFQGKVQNKF